MKFELRPPPSEETSSDFPAGPGGPGPAPAQEPAESGVRSRYGRAIDDALSSLAQLQAHTWTQHLAQDAAEHGTAPNESEVGSGEAGAEAVFRPDRLSGRAGGAR